MKRFKFLMTFEEVAYANQGNTTGMGNVQSPTAGNTPGVPGGGASYNMSAHSQGAGSGDIGSGWGSVQQKSSAYSDKEDNKKKKTSTTKSKKKKKVKKKK